MRDVGDVWKVSYVFFVELALVDDGLVGCIDARELLFGACREGEEEVGDDERLNEYMSSERQVTYLLESVWCGRLSKWVAYLELK